MSGFQLHIPSEDELRRKAELAEAQREKKVRQLPQVQQQRVQSTTKRTSHVVHQRSRGRAVVVRGGYATNSRGSKRQRTAQNTVSARSVTISFERHGKNEHFRNALKRCATLQWQQASGLDVDVLLNKDSCALITSARTVLLNVEAHLIAKIRAIQRGYRLRLLFFLVDTADCGHALNIVNRVALEHNMIVMVAWSWTDIASYLSQFKIFENKPIDALQGRLSADYATRAEEVLTTFPSVNKTDSAKLLRNFGSIAGILQAPMDELIMCPGVGLTKVQSLDSVGHMPFKQQ